MKKRLLALGLAAVLGANIAGTSAVWAADKVEITNVSYDPTRELYEQYNKVFAEHWKEQTGGGSDTVSRRLRQTGTGSCNFRANKNFPRQDSRTAAPGEIFCRK